MKTSLILMLPPPPYTSEEDILVSVRIPGIGVGVTVCIHHISLINKWNFTVLAWIHHWDKANG